MAEQGVDASHRFDFACIARCVAIVASLVFSTATASAADAAWTPVKASEWRDRSSSLVGKKVELSGNLTTMTMVSRTNSFSNTAMVSEGRSKKGLATVLFDEVDDATLQWIIKNRCRETCAGVFIRGTVVPAKGRGAPPVLRVSEMSFESKAGAAAPGDKQAGAVEAADKSGKSLLPPHSVPTKEGWAKWTSQLPENSPQRKSAQNMWGQMTAHSDAMRQQDFDQARGIIRGPERPADFATYYRGARDTGLKDLFVASKWNTGNNPWPRVALVVEEKPKGGGTLLYRRAGDKINDQCWRLHAKVWTGPGSSRDIAPFNWCLSEMRYNVAYQNVASWGKTPKTSMVGKNTGQKRTLGPNPPSIPVPKHQFDDPFYGDTIMLGNVMLDMGFNCSVPDGRVWVLDEAKSASAKH